MRNNFMFIAMSKFEIGSGHQEAFKEFWKRRDKLLGNVKGFQSFNLAKGLRIALRNGKNPLLLKQPTKTRAKNRKFYLARPIFEGREMVL